MGNSGSMHNLATIDDQQFAQQYQQYQQQLYAQQQHEQKWAQSFPRPTQQPQIKVLPDSVPGPKVLRNTNNGAILNSGGTLTKPGPGVQRSKSISSTHQYPPHPNMVALRERSRTQLNMIEEQRETKITNYKRFGSEPDLRVSGDEKPGGNSLKHPETAAEKGRSKLLKGKKKKAAPAPPPAQSKSTNDYDPSRFGWRPSKSSEPQPPPPKEPPPRKMRLFKTKAESKKPNTANLKIAAEASDAHFRKIHETKKENFRVIESHPRESFRTYDEEIEKKFNRFDEIETDRVSDDLEWKKSHARVIPMPQFRREKSFDVSLLGSSSVKKVEDYLKNRRQRAPSPVGQGRSNRYPGHEGLKPIVENSKNSIRKVKEEAKKKISNPTPSRSSGGTSFQQELLEATKRRSNKIDDKVLDKKVEDLPPIRPIPRSRYAKNDPRGSTTKSTLPQSESSRKVVEERKLAPKELIEVVKPEDRKLPNTVQAVPAKTFYFGMDENAEPEMVDNIMDRTQLDAIDRFAESLMKRKTIQKMNESSESALSSDVEDAMEHKDMEIIPVDGEPEGISLQLRPTLPKKQFEIPRFSPAAAWRLLAPEDDQKESAKYYHPEKVNLEPISVRNQEDSNRSEDRIERIYREPMPGFPDNKSGDSGISGDAGLPEESTRIPNDVEASPAITNAKMSAPFLSAWTPQQDLGEELSSDGEEVQNKTDSAKLNGTRGHVFSLSLPREAHIAQGDKPSFTTNSLQKLKKTVSGAFSGSSNQEKNENVRSDNWLLSRSAPNSIDNCQRSKFTQSTQSEIEESSTDNIQTIQVKSSYNHVQPISITASKKPPSFGYLTGGKHMMYLPNHNIGESSDYKIEDQDDQHHHKVIPEKIDENDNDSLDDSVSKVHDDDHNLEQRPYYRKSREDLQDPPLVLREYQSSKKSKNHRFTFQSTVRQIERRRIADKLSKEAEQKEAQRLSELEAMRRVEEEFQKKRAREKAGLRQQLRMFSMEDDQCASLPVDWSSRAEPDGAVSSPVESPLLGNKNKTSERSDSSFVDTKTPYISRIIEQKTSKSGKMNHPPPTTEVLSEFRQTRREYKEYLGHGNKPSSPVISMNSSNYKTENPTVVCNIPPSRGFGYGDMDYKSDNYRREFARGGRSINSSDSEISGFSLTGSGKQRVQQTSRF